MNLRKTQIYVVTTEGDCEGKSTTTIGYATGDQEDIKAFYDDKKFYQLRLHKVNVIDVEPGLVAERRALVDEQKDLEERLATVKKELGR